MNTELKELIGLVKKSNKPVQQVVDEYMSSGWSMLVDEYNRMTEAQKSELVRKLEQERA